MGLKTVDEVLSWCESSNAVFDVSPGILGKKAKTKVEPKVAVAQSPVQVPDTVAQNDHVVESDKQSVKTEKRSRSSKKEDNDPASGTS